MAYLIAASFRRKRCAYSGLQLSVDTNRAEGRGFCVIVSLYALMSLDLQFRMKRLLIV